MHTFISNSLWRPDLKELCSPANVQEAAKHNSYDFKILSDMFITHWPVCSFAVVPHFNLQRTTDMTLHWIAV
jgi:hypothetical protein